MAVGTYAELQAAVSNWLNREDFAVRVPEFIELAEARLRRVVDGFEMEARAVATATSEYLTLPSDFDTMRHAAVIEGGVRYPLREMEYAALTDAYRWAAGARPQAFAIMAGRLVLAPAPSADGVAVEMVYRRSLPRLSTSEPTNWLLDSHPDIYLFSALVQAEFYGWNDDRLRLIKTALDEALAELSKQTWDARTGAAPVAPALRRLK